MIWNALFRRTEKFIAISEKDLTPESIGNFAQLPTEIWFKIQDHLPLEDQAKSGAVCKGFLFMRNQHWEKQQSSLSAQSSSIPIDVGILFNHPALGGLGDIRRTDYAWLYAKKISRTCKGYLHPISKENMRFIFYTDTTESLNWYTFEKGCNLKIQRRLQKVSIAVLFFSSLSEFNKAKARHARGNRFSLLNHNPNIEIIFADISSEGIDIDSSDKTYHYCRCGNCEDQPLLRAIKKISIEKRLKELGHLKENSTNKPILGT